MNHTLRTLNYTITKEQMDKVEGSSEYLDLIMMAGFFNAICFAQVNGAHYQLASFAIDERHLNETRETIYLTGGLLFDAFIEMERLVATYKKQPYVMEFEEILLSCRDYKPPEVLLEVRYCGPFRLKTDDGDFSLPTHKMHLFPMFTVEQKGYAVACVADESETMEQFKRTGEIPETLKSLEDIVDYIVDEFTLGAEEFLFEMARRLGLEPVEQLRLAA